MAASAAVGANAIDDDACEHKHHSDEDHQVGRDLWTGHGPVVMFEAGVEMSDQVGDQSEADDDQSQLRPGRDVTHSAKDVPDDNQNSPQ